MTMTHPRSTDVDPERIEDRIIRAYVRLARTSYLVDDTRSVRLMRVGALEIRMTEIALSAELPGMPLYWLEVYSPATGATLERLGCFEFDEDELAAAVRFVQDAVRRPRALN
jgi:hypothetical protein